MWSGAERTNSRMMLRQSADLTKPMYLTMLSCWQRPSVSKASSCRFLPVPRSRVSQARGTAADAASACVRGCGRTSIMRSSLLGRSAILICLTATASPVPQLKAL